MGASQSLAKLGWAYEKPNRCGYGPASAHSALPPLARSSSDNKQTAATNPRDLMSPGSPPPRVVSIVCYINAGGTFMLSDVMTSAAVFLTSWALLTASASIPFWYAVCASAHVRVADVIACLALSNADASSPAGSAVDLDKGVDTLLDRRQHVGQSGAQRVPLALQLGLLRCHPGLRVLHHRPEHP